jgi:hypothetical protein
VAVREVVGEQRADHADQHDREPVDTRHITAQPELHHQGRDQGGGEDQRGVGQPESKRLVDVVGEALPTVVQRIFTIQKYTVTSGTLLSISRRRLVSAGVVVMPTNVGDRY